MTLNSEGLEKAWRFDIQHGPDGEANYAWVYNGKDLVATMRTHHAVSIVEAMNRRALPPIDGLEVVAWDVAPKGLPAEPTKSHSFVAEIEKQGGVISPLVTLSQASSVIAGLKEEVAGKVNAAWLEGFEKGKKETAAADDTLVDRHRDPKTGVFSFPSDVAAIVKRLDAAEARISSLEEENKRLREALTPSSSTKAAYMGEFSIAIERHINEDEEVDDEAEEAPDPYEHVTVPWTTIKEIMAAIRAYAQTEDHNG